MRLKGKRAVITGAGSGFGRATTLRFVEEGARVIVADIDPKKAAETVALAGAGCEPLAADVSTPEGAAAAVEACVQCYGGIDVLVNNAAYAYRGEIGALDVGRMKQMFETNVFGLVDITNRVVPQMKARGSGDIVNVASTSGMKGAATATPYAASKWAVRGISQCWQAELRPHGIRVVCVCPSEVQTNFGGLTGRNNPNKLYAADIAETIMAALNMPRRALWPELAVFANNPWKED